HRMEGRQEDAMAELGLRHVNLGGWFRRNTVTRSLDQGKCKSSIFEKRQDAGSSEARVQAPGGNNGRTVGWSRQPRRPAYLAASRRGSRCGRVGTACRGAAATQAAAD